MTTKTETEHKFMIKDNWYCEGGKKVYPASQAYIDIHLLPNNTYSDPIKLRLRHSNIRCYPLPDKLTVTAGNLESSRRWAGKQVAELPIIPIEKFHVYFSDTGELVFRDDHWNKWQSEGFKITRTVYIPLSDCIDFRWGQVELKPYAANGPVHAAIYEEISRRLHLFEFWEHTEGIPELVLDSGVEGWLEKMRRMRDGGGL